MVNYTIGDALRKGIALLNKSLTQTPGLDARILLCHTLKCDSLYLTIHRDDEMPDGSYDKFFGFIQRRLKNEPVGYITGKKEFMSLDFDINTNVLIPRPDTEILVERVINELNGIKNPVIIDMCTGSGAIAVSLAKYITGSKVTGIDISEEALKIASANAMQNKLEVSFELFDVLEPYNKIMADAIVSNPPYIPTKDINSLQSNVTDYEPRLALDGGEDGLVFYRAIVQNAHSCLKKGGLLAFEIGCGQEDDVMAIMEPYFSHISTECDLASIVRVVYGYAK